MSVATLPTSSDGPENQDMYLDLHGPLASVSGDGYKDVMTVAKNRIDEALRKTDPHEVV